MPPPSTRSRSAATWSGRRSTGTRAPPRRSASAPCRPASPTPRSPTPRAGPVTHYFGPVSGDAAGGAARSRRSRSRTWSPPTAGARPSSCRPKAGLRFCGTSAAAPHAAAVAALARQANPAPDAGGDPLRARPDREAGRRLRPRRRRRRPRRRPPHARGRRPAAGDRDRRTAPAARAGTPGRASASAPNRPVSFACSIDGSVPLPCSSPFTPLERLADGLHGFAVRGEDVAGRVGVSDTVLFRVDTVAPRTRFRRHPRRRMRTRRRRAKAVFVFASNERGSAFRCRVDGGLRRFCPRRFVRRFGAGRHVVRVAAVDAVGNVDRSPATFRLRVKRVGRRHGPPRLTLPSSPLSATAGARSGARRGAGRPARRRCRRPEGRSGRGPRAGCRNRPRAR